MSIKYAILGLLSWKPSTGYEMKKVFEESPVMYWSGNNNQIYKSLIQLLDEGLVTSELQHQEASPSKKIYTITEDGLTELKKWVITTPEAPEIKKTFLVQLAWADQLNEEELNGLLLKYENEIKIQLLIHQEKSRRRISSPDRSLREIFLWDAIFENLISSLKNELDWVQGIRNRLFEKEVKEEKEKMKYEIIQTNDKRYMKLNYAPMPLGTEKDALDIIALCGENDTNLIMIHFNVLQEGFFRNKSSSAAVMLQTFSNYFIKAAVVLPEDFDDKEKSRVMSMEISKADNFKVFESREIAEAWLVR